MTARSKPSKKARLVEKGGTWHAIFADADGVIQEVDTETESKGKANAILRFSVAVVTLKKTLRKYPEWSTKFKDMLSMVEANIGTLTTPPGKAKAVRALLGVTARMCRVYGDENRKA